MKFSWCEKAEYAWMRWFSVGSKTICGKSNSKTLESWVPFKKKNICVKLHSELKYELQTLNVIVVCLVQTKRASLPSQMLNEYQCKQLLCKVNYCLDGQMKTFLNSECGYLQTICLLIEVKSSSRKPHKGYTIVVWNS